MHDENEYCQHKFITDVIETKEFEEADSIIITVARGDSIVPFAWGDSLVHIRGLAEMTADYYRDQPMDC